MKLEKISADEAHNLRKDVANDMGVMAKGVPVVPDVVRAAKWDDDAREARFVMSAEVADRMGDVVVQEGLDTTNFEANPQALLFHNSRSWPIGSWKDVGKQLGGRPKRTEGTMKLLPLGEDEDADRAARHIKHGTMRTVSIGFRPKWETTEAIRDDDGHMTGLRFNEGELLECSLVPIPALPAAAMKELTTGMLSAESLELIKGILEQFDLKDGKVLNRDLLETVVRDTEGKKTHFHFDLSLMPVGSNLKKAADGTIVLTDATGTVLAGGETDDLLRHPDGSSVLRGTGPLQAPEPKDGEQVPVAPNPADTEKQKTAAELALHPVSALDPVLANDIAKTIREEAQARGAADSLMTRLLRTVLPFTTKSDPEQDPVKTDEELAAEANALELRKSAAIAAAASVQAKAAEILV